MRADASNDDDDDDDDDDGDDDDDDDVEGGGGDGDSDVYGHVHACTHVYVDAHASAQQGFGGLLLALVAWRRKASVGLCSRSCRSAAPLRVATSASCRMIGWCMCVC